jgi:hypothetical protein
LAGGADFDAVSYNAIFEADFPHVLFIGAGNADDIQNDPRGVMALLKGLAPGVQLTRLMDRDERTEGEIAELRRRQIRVLRRRHVESYLLDDRVLQRLCGTLGRPEAAPELLAAKQVAIANSVANGGTPDDMKRVAGDVYNATRRLFPAARLGSDKRAFMRSFCAPEVRQVPELYNELREDVFGR